MKHYEELKKEIVEKELLRITCDRCNEEIPGTGNYSYRTFELNFAEGKAYPDGSYGDGWEVEDLCNSCVMFLRELLGNNGFTIKNYDW
jgi:hypothetical protein